MNTRFAMCPICLANLALFAVSAASTGGLTALAFRKARARRACCHAK